MQMQNEFVIFLLPLDNLVGKCVLGRSSDRWMSPNGADMRA